MKIFLSLIFFFFSATLFAQETNGVDSLSFCFINYKVPEGCTAQSQYQVSCDNYSMMWLYLTPNMLNSLIEQQFVDQLLQPVKVVKKEPVTCFLLGAPAQGYLVSFKEADRIAYQVIAYGTANHQPVLVQLMLAKEPKKNEDIPEFPRRIIRLTK